MRLIHALARPVVRDAGLVVLLGWWSHLLAAGPVSRLLAGHPAAPGIDEIWRTRLALWWVFALPAAASLFLRRRWPLPALALATVSGVAHAIDRDLFPLPLDLAAVVAIYAVARVASTRRKGLLVLTGTVTTLYAALLISTSGLGPPTLYELIKGAPPVAGAMQMVWSALEDAAAPALALGVAWAVGDNTRTRLLHLATLEQRAADLRRERDHRAALAVAAERARITRELHDVVAHGISVMVVQAQGGAAALRNHPDQAASALAAVVDTGRASLAEMRRLLGLARADGAGAADGGRRAPQPGLGDLPALIDQVRDAGTPVTLTLDGEPAPLPAGVDLSAYRIVQEALTNTIKHAGRGATATVRLVFHPGELEIDISDTGTSVESVVEGNGLRGISERVRLLGGTVQIECRRAEGGFQVMARLPTGTAG